MFTFKTVKASGRYSWCFNSNHYIKLNKVVIGSIGDDPPHKIRLMVEKADINEDGNPNCPWKWIMLKKESADLQEAKEFLNKNFEAINAKFKIWKEKQS